MLKSKGLSAEITQSGKLAVQKLSDPDSEIFYSVNTGLIQSVLKTGHSIGDTVNANVDYVLVRGIVQSAQVIEN